MNARFLDLSRGPPRPWPVDFDPPLVAGRLVRRYKRFLADVVLADGTAVTAHCPNTGAMLGCDRPDAPVWLRPSAGPRRKLPFTWELVEVGDGTLVGINTHRANSLVGEALEAGRIPALAGYPARRPEVRYGREGSRIDFLLQDPGGAPDCYLEVKNVTAAVTDGVALFPDAVTARGTRHLRELAGEVGAGRRAMVLFCVQRGDVTEVRPADAIDPAYGAALREAAAAGVEVAAWRAAITVAGAALDTPLPVRLDPP